MGLFDWLDLGASAAGGGDDSWESKLANALPGNLGICMGDALETFILGGEETSIFGRYYQMTVDIESFLSALIPTGIGGLVGGAVLGANGYCNYVYGRNVGTFYGENITVERTVTAKATGKNYLWDILKAKIDPAMFAASGGPTLAGGATAGQVSVDKWVGGICGFLAALQALSSLAFNLVIYIKYPTPDPASYEEQQLQNLESEMNYIATHRLPPGTSVEQLEAQAIGGSAPGPAANQKLFINLAWTIPNRLGAIINELELAGQAARDADQSMFVALKMKAAKDLVGGWLTTAGTNIEQKLAAAGAWLDQAATRIAAAISEYKWTIAVVVAVLVILAIAVGALLGSMAAQGKL